MAIRSGKDTPEDYEDRIVKLNSGEVVEIVVNKNKLKASEISWG